MKHETRQLIKGATKRGPQPVNVATHPVDDYSRLDMKQKTVDWNNKSDRKWLNGHLHWAMLNKQIVTLQPL